MPELFSHNFISPGSCYLWKPGQVSLYILSNSLISLAYFLIPIELIYSVKKRQDVPWDWVFMLFGSLIIGCKITYLIEIWVLWHPHDGISSFLKAITAVISLCTVVVIIELIPKILLIPRPVQPVPFLMTKPSSYGTGAGLAISDPIIKTPNVLKAQNLLFLFLNSSNTKIWNHL